MSDPESVHGTPTGTLEGTMDNISRPHSGQVLETRQGRGQSDSDRRSVVESEDLQTDNDTEKEHSPAIEVIQARPVERAPGHQMRLRSARGTAVFSQGGQHQTPNSGDQQTIPSAEQENEVHGLDPSIDETDRPTPQGRNSSPSEAVDTGADHSTVPTIAKMEPDEEKFDSSTDRQAQGDLGSTAKSPKPDPAPTSETDPNLAHGGDSVRCDDGKRCTNASSGHDREHFAQTPIYSDYVGEEPCYTTQGGSSLRPPPNMSYGRGAGFQYLPQQRPPAPQIHSDHAIQMLLKRLDETESRYDNLANKFEELQLSRQSLEHKGLETLKGMQATLDSVKKDRYNYVHPEVDDLSGSMFGLDEVQEIDIPEACKRPSMLAQARIEPGQRESWYYKQTSMISKFMGSLRYDVSDDANPAEVRKFFEDTFNTCRPIMWLQNFMGAWLQKLPVGSQLLQTVNATINMPHVAKFKKGADSQWQLVSETFENVVPVGQPLIPFPDYSPYFRAVAENVCAHFKPNWLKTITLVHGRSDWKNKSVQQVNAQLTKQVQEMKFGTNLPAMSDNTRAIKQFASYQLAVQTRMSELDPAYINPRNIYEWTAAKIATLALHVEREPQFLAQRQLENKVRDLTKQLKGDLGFSSRKGKDRNISDVNQVGDSAKGKKPTGYRRPTDLATLKAGGWCIKDDPEAYYARQRSQYDAFDTNDKRERNKKVHDIRLAGPANSPNSMGTVEPKNSFGKHPVCFTCWGHGHRRESCPRNVGKTVFPSKEKPKPATVSSVCDNDEPDAEAASTLQQQVADLMEFKEATCSALQDNEDIEAYLNSVEKDDKQDVGNIVSPVRGAKAIVVDDSGTRALVDTGSNYNIMSFVFYCEQRQNQRATELKESSKLSLGSCSDGDSDLHYVGDSVLTLTFGGVNHGVVMRVCRRYRNDEQVLLGIEGQQQLAVVVNVPKAQIAIRQPNGSVMSIPMLSKKTPSKQQKLRDKSHWSSLTATIISHTWIESEETDDSVLDQLSTWEDKADPAYPGAGLIQQIEQTFSAPTDAALYWDDIMPEAVNDKLCSTSARRVSPTHSVCMVEDNFGIDPDHQSDQHFRMEGIFNVFDKLDPWDSSHNQTEPITVVHEATYREIDTTKPVYEQLDLKDNAYIRRYPHAKAVIASALDNYKAVFQMAPEGRIKLATDLDGKQIEVDLLLQDETPFIAPSYRLNPKMEKQIQDNLQEMESLGVIRKNSSSPWGFQEICTPKPDGTYRSVSDLRPLNKKMFLYSYPLMTEADVFNQMGGSTLFTTLDLSKYFWSFKLTPRSQEICTIRGPTGVSYSYNCLPMGLKNSPAIAQAHIDRVLRQKYDGPGPMHGRVALGNFVVPYLDDITVYTDKKNEPYHADYVAWVLRQLYLSNLTARLDKCYLFVPKVGLLGHILDKNGLHPDPKKVEAISKMPRPTDKAGVRSLLGFTGYLRKFIPEYAHHTLALTNLLKKDVVFNQQAWIPACEEEYQFLLTALARAPVLALPDWSKEFIIRTDASDKGISYILLQDHDGVRKPVYYGSRKLRDAELNYDTRDKECLAIDQACKFYRPYIQGNHFTVQTDHRNLMYLKQAKPEQRRLYNMALRLNALNFSMEHHPGVTMHDADHLSRHPLQAETTPGSDDDDYQNWEQTNDGITKADMEFHGDMSVANTYERGIPHSKIPVSDDRLPAIPTPLEAFKMLEKPPPPGPKYKVLILGYGILSDHMAMNHDRFSIIGGCEINTLAASRFETVTGGKHYGSINDLSLSLSDGLLFPKIDVLVSTMDCGTRSKFNRINKAPSSKPSARAFFDQVALIEKVKPDVLLMEHAPPDGDEWQSDHRKLKQLLHRSFRDITAFTLNTAEHGDITCRDRWFLVGSNIGGTFGAADIPTLSPTPYVHLLQKPETVHPSLRTRNWVPVTNVRDGGAYRPKRVGTIGGGRADALHNRVYSPERPWPTITKAYSRAYGNLGGQWILDREDLGPRTLTIKELASFHSFDRPTIAFLENIAKGSAMEFIARSVPVQTLTHIWRQIENMLKKRDDNNLKLHPEIAPTVNETFVSKALETVFPPLEELSRAQQSDPEIAPVYNYVADNKVGPAPQNVYTRYLPYLRMHQGVLFLRDELSDGMITTDAVVIPTSLREQVIRAIHSDPTMAHPGQFATYLAVASRAFWPHMRKQISKYCSDCGPCKKTRHQTRTHAGQLRTQMFLEKGDAWGVDLVGPLQECDQQKYILHACCWTTGWNVTDTLPDKTALTVARSLLQKVFLVYGFPKRLFSDQGKEFINSILKEVTTSLKVKQCFTAAYSPQGNARTENRHRYYNQILRILVNELGYDWVNSLPFATWCLNTRPWKGTPYSPYQLLFGREPRFPFDLDLSSNEPIQLAPSDILEHTDVYIKNCSALVEDAIITTQRQNRISADKHRYTMTYDVGDLVLVHTPRIRTGVAARLTYQSTGPYEVLPPNPQIRPNPDGSYNVYRLRHLASNKIITSNVRQMMPYISRAAHEAEKGTILSSADEPDKPEPFEPDEGDFLLLPQSDRKIKHHLLQVLNRDGDEVVAQYYNTTRPNRLVNFKKCWAHPTKMEIQSMQRPKFAGYEPWTDTFVITDFCQSIARPIRIGTKRVTYSYRLAPKEVARLLKRPPL